MSKQVFPLKDIDVMEHKFTVYGTWENPLFLVKDIAEFLEYDSTSTSKMIEGVDEDEKLLGIIFRAGQNRTVRFLTESGLYEALFLSAKPAAKEFKKNVKKVLHELRTTGRYEAYPRPDYQSQERLIQMQRDHILACQQMLNLGDDTVADMLNQIGAPMGAPQIAYTDIPDAAIAASTLLKDKGYDMTAQQFNLRAEKAGFLEHMRRPSHKYKDGEPFWCVTPDGLKYGKNKTYNKCKDKTQPLWYVHSFDELMEIINAQVLD